MNDREHRITQLLRERGELSVSALVAELGTSEATVRRYLASLETAGALTRTFGGARLREPPSLVVRTFEQKRDVMRAEKERIAKCAAQLVEPGMSVALDSGTTTWRVAATLRDRAPLDVVTNALPVIEELGAVEEVRIHCAGGRFNLDNLDFMGGDTASALTRFHVNVAFLGIDSLIPGRGVFSNTQEDADNLRALGESADRCVVVADHTKVNTKGLHLALGPDQVDCVVMDSGVAPETKASLEAEPYELLIAE